MKSAFLFVRSRKLRILALGALWLSAHEVSATAQDRGPATTRTRRSVSSAAPKVTTETTTRELPSEREEGSTGLALFMGAGGGAMSLGASDDGSEGAKRGPSYQGRLSLTLFNSYGVLDLGLGYLYNQVSGVDRIVSTTSSSTTDSTVLTRAGIVEFSPRLRLGSVLEIGPLASVLFGTDANFSEKMGGVNAPLFAGGKIAAQFESRHILFRFSGQGQTSLTLNRNVILAGGSIEIGIPLIGGRTVVRETETNTVRDNFQTETLERETTVVKEVVREVVLFSFDDQVVHFEFDRATLLPDSREFISELGRFLASHPRAWGRVEIQGHTDQRGTEEYNLALSAQRAASVVQALLQTGVPRDRLSSRGFGKSRPIDPDSGELALARNRRVEMSFSDVVDARLFRDAINRIRLRTTHPATCTGSGCR